MVKLHNSQIGALVHGEGTERFNVAPKAAQRKRERVKRELLRHMYQHGCESAPRRATERLHAARDGHCVDLFAEFAAQWITPASLPGSITALLLSIPFLSGLIIQ